MATLPSMTRERRARRVWRPFAVRLAEELAALLDDVDVLLDGSKIVNIDPNDRWSDSDAVFIGFPLWGWKPDGDEQTQRRLDLLKRWEQWRQLFGLLFPDPPPDVKTRIGEGTKLINAWLKRPGGDHSVPSTIAAAKVSLREGTKGLGELLTMAAAADPGVVAIPDTNALIDAPDVATYGSVLGTDRFDVRLIAPVTAELDRLKREGRTPELREKVQSVIRRIKGFRDRGNLVDGVQLTHDVRFFSQAREPDFSRMPEWLDRDNADDRILACALELQGSHAAATVVLVTSDLNLQTKADAAGLPYVEPPHSI